MLTDPAAVQAMVRCPQDELSNPTRALPLFQLRLILHLRQQTLGAVQRPSLPRCASGYWARVAHCHCQAPGSVTSLLILDRDMINIPWSY